MKKGVGEGKVEDPYVNPDQAAITGNNYEHCCKKCRTPVFDDSLIVNH